MNCKVYTHFNFFHSPLFLYSSHTKLSQSAPNSTVKRTIFAINHQRADGSQTEFNIVFEQKIDLLLCFFALFREFFSEVSTTRCELCRLESSLSSQIDSSDVTLVGKNNSFAFWSLFLFAQIREM